MYNILICDDEKDIVSALEIYLHADGYETFSAGNGVEALEILSREEIHLVLMDIMMPKMDGLSATARLREEYNVPVILLTAKGEDTDKVLGLNIGADDYVTKPFNIMEVKARVRTVLRRTLSHHPLEDRKIIRVKEMEVNLLKRTCIVRGKDVKLTAKEFDLLQLLITNRGRPYTRQEMLETIWRYRYTGDDRTVDVHIRRLREKVERDTTQPEYILTKWKVGYYFTDKD